jgi:mono/diheme cytochrome c family protein
MNRRSHIHLIMILSLIFIGLLLFACGGDEPETAGAPAPTPTRRLAATPLSTHVFAQPTTIIKASAAEQEGTAEATPEADLSRGERTYNNRGCAECHGANGEGVESKGSALAGTALTEADFTDLLRTGGEGKLGNDHLYGTQAISPSGMEALYAYIKSFQP